MKRVRNLSEITAVILAGGLGTRLRSKVSDRPKVLAEVQGRPFITYLLDQLWRSGIKKTILCIGYLGDQVRSVLGETYGKGISLAYSQEKEPFGTAGAIRLAFPLFDSNPLLVMNGDSFCKTSLEAFWAWHLDRKAKATILLTEMSDTQHYGQVDLDSNGRVIHFSEKDPLKGPGWINAGLYLIDQNLLNTIPPNRPVSLEEEMLPSWIGQGLYGFQSKGFFIDIGRPETYTLAERLPIGERI